MFCGPSEPELITVQILWSLVIKLKRQRRTRRPSSAKPKTPLARREKEKKKNNLEGEVATRTIENNCKGAEKRLCPSTRGLHIHVRY
jgi:hypothetical protein